MRIEGGSSLPCAELAMDKGLLDFEPIWKNGSFLALLGFRCATRCSGICSSHWEYSMLHGLCSLSYLLPSSNSIYLLSPLWFPPSNGASYPWCLSSIVFWTELISPHPFLKLHSTHICYPTWNFIKHIYLTKAQITVYNQNLKQD